MKRRTLLKTLIAALVPAPLLSLAGADEPYVATGTINFVERDPYEVEIEAAWQVRNDGRIKYVGDPEKWYPVQDWHRMLQRKSDRMSWYPGQDMMDITCTNPSYRDKYGNIKLLGKYYILSEDAEHLINGCVTVSSSNYVYIARQVCMTAPKHKTKTSTFGAAGFNTK